MGFLAPGLLFLGLAVAVPLVLHLFQRQHGRRLVFPALRYLRRAEKEHARRIKLRQLLLLGLRIAILLLLAAAAARPFVRGGGEGHEPTAVAIILDNSLSSGLVVGEARALDELKALALETVARARPEDRFWLIRSGSPWDPAPPGDAETTARRIEATEVSAGGADLGAALRRARALLDGGADGRAREIHVLTDLQRTALGRLEPAEGDAPRVILWAPRREPPSNAAVTAVEIGGGLPPRAGERSVVTARLDGERDADSVAVRLVLEGRISGAAHGALGSEVAVPFPARAAGLVTGWIEIDPDALRGDDRRFFVAPVQPPPAVVLAEPMPFVEDALEVLAAAGRIRLADAAAAEVVLAPGAAGADALRRGRTVVAMAPATDLELPAANRRLAGAGVPWRFGAAGGGGEARFAVEDDEADAAFRALADTRVRRVFPLEPQGAAAEQDTILLRLQDGTAWAVRGELPDGGRYLVVASPLTAEASTLPVSPAMLPVLDRMVGAWVAGEPGARDLRPGDRIVLPADADAIERPDGTREPAAGGVGYRAPGQAGVYRVLAGDRVLDAFAVNAPPEESRLERADPRQVRSALEGWDARVARDAGEWARATFHTRHGREVWRTVLLLALAILLIEGLVAAAGAAGSRTRGQAGGAARDAASPRSPRREPGSQPTPVAAGAGPPKRET